ncbi:MAG TPA: PEP-CTERM sorting domain-containing protein [Aquabacterium sp.]|uniref:PEP-CTERM sorting domain-containing protein n=1 Tax=Aquabacterium sp. TaxID=1872578 RepID=UPI002E372C57|nr:PEP-CTERM sorting domain-containing protein [Aquabacterium sp.]HEX5354901.1 PEP-CTERM sorting domain-containing protein [Aquabacterium sp.]
MIKPLLILATLVLAGLPMAQAATATYNVTTVWYEPDTRPNDSIFVGTFDYDITTHAITNLQGQLSESMTGNSVGYPNDSMTWLTLGNQLVSWYDAALGGTFAATFKNADTRTFWTGLGGDGWSPEAGIAAGGVYDGFPKAARNPGNAYALIFVPNDPLSPLTQAQLDKLAYADCAPGGMMGAVCMTGTSLAGYGAVGTMSGVPASQVITASVPEAGSLEMAVLGAGIVAWLARRRKTA